jgi:hypothetical protein
MVNTTTTALNPRMMFLLLGDSERQRPEREFVPAAAVLILGIS